MSFYALHDVEDRTERKSFIKDPLRSMQKKVGHFEFLKITLKKKKIPELCKEVFQLHERCNFLGVPGPGEDVSPLNAL